MVFTISTKFPDGNEHKFLLGCKEQNSASPPHHCDELDKVQKLQYFCDGSIFAENG
jgi:hypothetical protein